MMGSLLTQHVAKRNGRKPGPVWAQAQREVKHIGLTLLCILSAYGLAMGAACVLRTL